jgi:hypothetical protein
VWTRIARALESGANAADAPLDMDPALDSAGIPWPVFVSLLIANGWFVSARGFKSARHIVMAGVRLLAFAGAWIAAFAWLPAPPSLRPSQAAPPTVSRQLSLDRIEV